MIQTTSATDALVCRVSPETLAVPRVCELALASYLLATLRQQVPDKEPDKVR